MSIHTTVHLSDAHRAQVNLVNGNPLLTIGTLVSSVDGRVYGEINIYGTDDQLEVLYRALRQHLHPGEFAAEGFSNA